MSHNKYPSYWVGIDGGREGLWREPIWSEVLRIVARHEGEAVYDHDSPIYQELEALLPDESWRSRTADGIFRPLFRDYSHAWTRTGVMSLQRKVFDLTLIGRSVLNGRTSKQEVLLTTITNHSEINNSSGTRERPFHVLSNAFLNSERPLSTHEIYWGVMQNYRPGFDDLGYALTQSRFFDPSLINRTAIRRLNSILSTMRVAGLIASTPRNSSIYWYSLEKTLLDKVATF